MYSKCSMYDSMPCTGLAALIVVYIVLGSLALIVDDPDAPDPRNLFRVHWHNDAARTGLVVDPYFSATKLGWLLDHVPRARARAEREYGDPRRYFAHRAYKTSRAVQFLLAFLAQSSAQRGILWWAATHRHHHKHSDTPEDVQWLIGQRVADGRRCQVEHRVNALLLQRRQP